jgi:hypothetical protein
VCGTGLIRLRVLEGHGAGYVKDPVLWGVGLAIWVLGLGVAAWARVYLGRNWGMPTSTKEDPELVQPARTGRSGTRFTSASRWR